jgi:two-component system cell cycle sensor histidine kinase/response regulator CckA
VLLAADGQQALEIYAASERKPDLVLSDPVMPGMTGPEVISQLQKTQTDLRCLFMSGYNSDALDLSRLPRGVEIVQKPSTAARLREAVVRALTARPPGLIELAGVPRSRESS